MAILGNDWKLYFGTAPTMSAGSWSAVAAELNSSMSINCESIDISSKGSDGWKTFLIGEKSATFNATAHLVPTDPTHQQLLDKMHEGGKLVCFYGVLASEKANSEGYIFSAYVTSANISSDKGGIVTIDVTLQVDGAVIRQGLKPEE